MPPPTWPEGERQSVSAPCPTSSHLLQREPPIVNFQENICRRPGQLFRRGHRPRGCIALPLERPFGWSKKIGATSCPAIGATGSVVPHAVSDFGSVGFAKK